MKQAPTPESLSRIVRWIVLVFIGYALWTGVLHKPKPAAPPPQTATAPASGSAPVAAAPAPVDCATQTNPLANLSMLAMPLLPSIVPAINVQDVTQGKGPHAACGQHASLRYQYTLPSGTVLFSNIKTGKPTEVTIGDNTLLHGVEMGIIGMAPGGTRNITFSPALGFHGVRNPAILKDFNSFTIKPQDLQEQIITGTVSLLSLSPDLPNSPQPLRIIQRRASASNPAHCGDPVSVEMTVWKLDGTKLFSTEDKGVPLVFTLGQSQVPFGLEQVLLGMGPGAERTAIIPPAFGKPLDEDATALIPNWPEETVLAEIHLKAVGNDALAQAAKAK